MVINTQNSQTYNCPGPGTAWVTWTAGTGRTIVAIGVQTVGNQSQFNIAQLFVSADGSTAFAQVSNRSGSGTQWSSWLSTTSNSSDEGVDGAAASAPEFGSQADS